MTEEVEAFRRAAEEYCALIEDLSVGNRDVYDAILERLAALYAAGHRLPRVEPATEDDLPDVPTTEDETALVQRLAAIFHTRNVYWLADPFEDEPEDAILAGSLSDDLAEVWRDVKQGLLALGSGASEADVVWDWRFGLDSHWGRHAVDALAALHKLRDL